MPWPVSPKTPRDHSPLPGGIYASPTNTRYRVHEPKSVAAEQTSPGRMHAAPTEQNKRQTTCKRLATAPYHISNLNFKRPQAAEHHNFSFLFFNFSFPKSFHHIFPFQHPVFPGGGAKRGFYTFSTGFSTGKTEKPNAGFSIRRAGRGSFPPFPPPLLRLRR